MVVKLPWNEARPSAVVLITGAEDLLASRAISSIRAQVRETDPEVEITVFDAAAYEPGVIGSAASPSLFGERRLIIAENVAHCSEAFHIDALEYLEHVQDDVVFILRHSSGVRGKKLLDAARRVSDSCEILCPPIQRDADRDAFARQEFRTAHRRITLPALRMLLEAFAGSLDELAAACQQLIADVEGDISEQHIQLYFGGRVETTAFKVVDVAFAGDTGEALVTLRHALATGADPVPIVAAFAAKLRMMAKVLDQPGSDASLAKTVSAAPWQVGRARRDLRSWNASQLGAAIAATLQTDIAVKGGSRDPLYALERLVVSIAERHQPVESLSVR